MKPTAENMPYNATEKCCNWYASQIIESWIFSQGCKALMNMPASDYRKWLKEIGAIPKTISWRIE